MSSQSPMNLSTQNPKIKSFKDWPWPLGPWAAKYERCRQIKCMVDCGTIDCSANVIRSSEIRNMSFREQKPMRFRVGPLGPPATAAAAAAWQGRPQGTTRASLMEYFAVTPPGDLAF